MRSVFLISLLLITPVYAWATHIVGGELNLQYNKQKDQYVLTLNLYFDDINGEREAEDDEVFIGVFSKKTNKQLATYRLPRVLSSQVKYTNAACYIGRLQTRQIQYSANVSVNFDLPAEAEGYYFSWERCCRNSTIANITDPGVNGMVFYLEFPSLIQNGSRFINSSPVFPMPKGDYACINEPFVFDFGATDADGDELKYSLITPSRGNSELTASPFGFGPGPHPGANDIFYPAPYKTVIWSPGFGLNNIIPGTQPLRVDSSTGQLSFIANRLGLYVFSVLCEEYRNGVKIGVVQRDFQLLVIDCPKNDAPVVQAREKNSSSFYQEEQIIRLSYDDGQPCFDVFASDSDSKAAITLQVNALNFPAENFTASSTYKSLTNPTDFLQSEICFNGCIPHTREEPLLLQVIALDNGCPIPKKDTVLVKVYIEPAPSMAPDVVTTLFNNMATIQTDQAINFNVIATDPDNDEITLTAIGRGFSLTEVGMQFNNSTGTGEITQPFSWIPTCEMMQQSATFTIDFLTEDNSCAPDRFDTVTVNLSIENFEVVISRFTPPNVFTPNNDGVNDYFEIPNLPPDNCSYTFRSIEVYNRWGKPVYTSDKREFQWPGLGFPTGTYFYQINYGAMVFKGTVSLLR